jgi:hypothetical protein
MISNKRCKFEVFTAEILVGDKEFGKTAFCCLPLKNMKNFGLIETLFKKSYVVVGF